MSSFTESERQEGWSVKVGVGTRLPLPTGLGTRCPLPGRLTRVGGGHSTRVQRVFRKGSSGFIIVIKPYSTSGRSSIYSCIGHLTGIGRGMSSHLVVVPHVCAGGPHAAKRKCGKVLRRPSPSRTPGLLRNVVTVHEVRVHTVGRAKLASTSRVLCPRGEDCLSSVLSCRTVNTHSMRGRRRHLATDKVSVPINVGGPADKSFSIVVGSMVTTRGSRGFVCEKVSIAARKGSLTRMVLHNNISGCKAYVPGCRCRSLIHLMSICTGGSLGGPTTVVSTGRSGSGGRFGRRVHVIDRVLRDEECGSSIGGVIGKIVVRDCVRRKGRGVYSRVACKGSVASPYLK